MVSIHIPPLRERLEDLPLLANYFLKKYSERIKKPVKGFSAEAMRMLGSHSYPGNVRQLENIVERAVIFSKGEVLRPDDLLEHLNSKNHNDLQFPIGTTNFGKARDKVLREFEAQFVRQLLAKHRGNVTDAAAESDMTRQNFQRLMKKHGIRSDQFR